MTYRPCVLAALTCLLVAASTIVTAQQPKPLNSLVGSPTIRGFGVALVLGDLQGASTPDNLPAGAKKALVDLRDFLPYKSYRLLDTQWILCCGTSKVGTGVAGRLRGISQGKAGEEHEYPFTVSLVGVSGSQLSVRFLMTDGGNPDMKKSPSKVSADVPGEDIQREKEMQRKIEELVRHPAGKGAIIDSTFSMDIGETVVIGTSSLKGDKALIAVLTAAKRSADPQSTLGEKR